MRSGYVLGDFTNSLDDNVREGGLITETRNCREQGRRVSGTVEYRSDTAVSNSFVLVSGKEDWTEVLWVSYVLMLLRMSCWTEGEVGKYACIQYMRCLDSLNEVDSLPGAFV